MTVWERCTAAEARVEAANAVQAVLKGNQVAPDTTDGGVK